MPSLPELLQCLFKCHGFDTAKETTVLFTNFLTLFAKKHQKTARLTGTLQKSCTLCRFGKNIYKKGGMFSADRVWLQSL
jgi:hypothetical protein